jgi:hypothetical protein
MTEPNTPRHQFPELAVAQSQKEITHNEALRGIDALLHPQVQSVMATPPTGLTLADAGKCWLVGETPTGAWSDKADTIAVWTGGSWRFHLAVEGMEVWDIAGAYRRIYHNGEWRQPPSVVGPSGGSVVDTEARAVLTALLAELKIRGILAV